MEIPDIEPIEGREFFNLLLWMPNWIGDIILVLPALQSLRKRFPNAKITLALRAPSHELLPGHPAVDAILRMPSGSDTGFFKQIHFARQLQKYRFDLGVVFSNSFRSAFLLYISGAKFRLGYNTDGRGIFLTHPTQGSPRSKTQYRVDYFFEVLTPLGLEGPELSFQPFISLELGKSLDADLTRLRGNSYNLVIALHPGGSKFPRRWHSERYGVLCQKLIKEYSAKILILCGSDDEEIAQRIENVCPPNSALKLSSLNLQQTAAAIGQCKLFIGNDSGMMHLAALMKIPIVAIFGPGSATTTGPYIASEKRVIVTKSYPCSPCRQNFFTECKPSPHKKPYCIEDISVMDVERAVQKMIASGTVKT
tara:strand:- start:5304 stop:6398 length:1095 start_codon:yes stop_codon:yes gene_type:complete